VVAAAEDAELALAVEVAVEVARVLDTALLVPEALGNGFGGDGSESRKEPIAGKDDVPGICATTNATKTTNMTAQMTFIRKVEAARGGNGRVL